MIPILQATEMAEVDRSAPEPVEALIARAGNAVASKAMELLKNKHGGVYGRRITVLAGSGNNGADGRQAAARLAARGASIKVIPATSLAAGERLDLCDLVIDAAYGTGLSRSYAAPDPGDTPVLAVDIPSGLSSTTGNVIEGGSTMRAEATVTFGALKPGLLLAKGPELAGEVTLADIGLGGQARCNATAWLMEDADVLKLLPPAPRETHKWVNAIQVVAGSPGMTGAAWLVSSTAIRAGARYVRLSIPGSSNEPMDLPPSEIVTTPLPVKDWASTVLEGLGRFKALVIGPGLGSSVHETSDVAKVVSEGDVPIVLDADGLGAFADMDALRRATKSRTAPLLITPHEGEFKRLTGSAPSEDRLNSVRSAAKDSGAIVLLKGSTTIVAEPDGTAFLSSAGGPRLATAGTGDALCGVIAALLAHGIPCAKAAALGAHIHGRAACTGLSWGLVATDIGPLVARWLSDRVG